MKLKKKRVIVIIFVTILLIFGVTIIIHNKNYNKIEAGYMIVFHGEEKNIEYETYIYEKDKNYKYINTKTKDNKIKVTKRGTVNSKEKIFEVAKKNKAYSYITMTNREERYMVEDFKPIFLK
jgi:hypothetical protein